MKFFYYNLIMCLITLIVFPSMKGICQIIPSADAMGLARYANIPVSYYSGTVGVDVPLMQLTGKELSVPINLNYNTSGIKVATIASTVGIGWNLNTGGQITRVVQGEVDNLAGGYCNGGSDTEPDLYFYNFLGQGGKFFLDKYGNAITIPFRNIIIKPGICKGGANGTWEIIDENGVSYKFGTSNSAVETTTFTPNSGTSKTFASTWLLSEVNSPNSTDNIQFYYGQGYYSWKSFSFSKRKDPCNNENVTDLTSTISVQAKYPVSIVSSNARVNFSYSFNRKDLTSFVSLSQVEMINNAGDLLGKYKFSYSHFKSDGCNLPECFRLKLDNIHDLAPDPLYTFSYNTSTNLPSRYSKNFDHWGYYNNNTVDSWFPYINGEVTVFFDAPAPIDISGASREPDPTRMKANILVGISERSGATKSFQYEAHSSSKSGVNQVIGGLRILSINATDGQGSNLTRSFSYLKESSTTLSSGIHYDKPRYMITYGNKTRYYMFSHPLLEFYELGGAHIGYSKVEESVTSGDKTTYYFTSLSTNPDPLQNGVVSDYSWSRGLLSNSTVFSQNNRQLSSQSIDYSFNRLDRASIGTKNWIEWGWDCGCGFLCRNKGSFKFSWSMNYFSRPVIATQKTTSIHDRANSLNKLTQIEQYSYDPNTYQLASITKYDASQPSKKYISSTKYVTDPSYYFDGSTGVDCYQQYLSCQANCASDPDSQTRSYCYTDCSNTYNNCTDSPPVNASPEVAALLKLRDRNQLVPVETTTQYQDASGTKLLTASVNLFTITGTDAKQVQLKETRGTNQLMDLVSFTSSYSNPDGSFVFDGRLRKLTSYDSYDQTTGNLLQQTGFDGIQTSYLWDSYGQPIQTTVTGGVDWRNVSNTFKPLVGKTSSTDANGRTSYFDYDVYNRPFTTKDHQGNLLSRARYHYKNETPGFVLNSSTTEGIAGQSSFSFYVADVAASIGGTPQFVWDLGDGTVVDNNSTSINHTYTNPGTYTVKLTGLNPEYGPTTRSVQINVSSPLSVTICEDGPTYKDLCGVDAPSYGACTVTQEPYSYMLNLTATPANGCASGYSYYWMYRNTNSTQWLSFGGSNGTSPQVSFSLPLSSGGYEIRCTVTDGCGNSVDQSTYVSVYKSQENCPVGH